MTKPEDQINPLPNQQVYIPQDDEIDLRELASAIWQGKWLIICITTAFIIASVLYAQSLPDEYRSTAILAPASTSSSSSLSGLASQFGGLASFAGVSLGGASGGDKTVVAIELLNTWGFLETFIHVNQLEVEVYAVKGWNKSSNKLLIDDSLYDDSAGVWHVGLDTNNNESEKPTSWKLYGKIKDRISISQNKKTGLISLSVEHYSPFVAKKWADLLVASINQHMQLQDRVEALNSIDYLKQQINKTDIAEMRTIFYQLIEEQTKTMMLAEYTDDLASLFTPEVEADYFKSKEQLLDKVNFYLSHKLTKSIGEAGYRRLIKDGHEVVDRCWQVIEKYKVFESL